MSSWAEFFNVAITGIVVVFIALVVLIIIVSIVGKIFSSLDTKKNSNSTGNDQPKVTGSPVPADTVAMEAEDGLTDEVVAAITAAIACVMTENGVTKPFRVKSIQRAGNSRNVWNMAGLLENTRPF
ncbi:Na+-transporting methylmalonyl-CoA/oxaloacetate decarboxylase%2C gamma subunit [uncultured Ruminococcus sp.]|uniref:OadG family protein n=1 Tax=Massiliimalia timonensis TaxID=1987501 RepID=A0A8J6PBF5_9FIRM|nr:OadG family transporter subunit [Massiliimalia timonensis]MBC8610313.1 OadG family protein [Massiliimalia timonensis]MBS7175439.1 OadG family protein [Clostridiales bacterium]SCG98875.1 Na+-transporting methylmalonyl-CoA/oxaloacetate decarboxylase%2C gamma subunit [uncultured Ruminococcus sp.]SCH70093.1 Na+-transporting methylmalonyl-CoA/oxaloacetate decarboxylase%2C gamma subunit [uncultured Clostridium sp.]